MAKGFATGLIQGGVVCGAALVALSLALPQPPRPGEVAAPLGTASENAAPVAPAQTVTPEIPPSETPPAEPPPAEIQPAKTQPDGPVLATAAPPETVPEAVPEIAPETASADPGPATDSLLVPAGSEFARSSDMQPRMPAPLTEAPRVAAAPTVAPPADEPAPARAEPERLRPETRGEAPAAPALAAPENDPVDLPELAGESPIPVPPPGKVEVPGLDRAPGSIAMRPDAAPVAPAAAPPPVAAPDLPDAADPAPIAEPETVIATQPAPEAAAQPVAPAPEPQPAPQPVVRRTPEPGAPRAVPDLSLPPDFDALKLTN